MRMLDCGAKIDCAESLFSRAENTTAVVMFESRAVTLSHIQGQRK